MGCASADAGQQKIVVNNPTGMQRHEVVEISEKLKVNSEKWVIRDAFGIEQPWQVTHDGKLLLYVSVRPHGDATYTIETGNPAPMKQYVAGKYYPERADDISFENDRTGFRIYGPETQRRGERAFGIDLWVKHSSELLVDSLYRLEFSLHPEIAELRKQGRTREADSLTTLTSYHLDHGAGMDGYGVGPTLGCGTPALMVPTPQTPQSFEQPPIPERCSPTRSLSDRGANDSLCYPWCYEKYEILDNGPLRFTLRLDFGETEIDGMKIREHRLMTLDRGSNFCKMTVWYEGLEHPVCLAAGCAIRTADTESIVLGDRYLLYADPTIDPERHNSQIYVGLLFPDEIDAVCTRLFPEPVGINAGHALGIRAGYTGQPYTYYIGMAWSDLDVRSFGEWQLRSSDFLSALRHPLTIHSQRSENRDFP